MRLAERVGFEPTCPLLAGKTLSRRPRYDRFGTSPRKGLGAGVWGLGTTPPAPETLHLGTFPPAMKELVQNSCAFFSQHAGDNLNLVIQLRVVEDG